MKAMRRLRPCYAAAGCVARERGGKGGQAAQPRLQPPRHTKPKHCVSSEGVQQQRCDGGERRMMNKGNHDVVKRRRTRDGAHSSNAQQEVRDLITWPLTACGRRTIHGLSPAAAASTLHVCAEPLPPQLPLLARLLTEHQRRQASRTASGLTAGQLVPLSACVPRW